MPGMDQDGAAGVSLEGKAAMLLMGHWRPARWSELTGLAENLAGVPFLTVEDGAGDPKDAFAAATASLSARMRRPRPSSSWSTSRARVRDAGRQRGEAPPDDRRVGGLDHRPDLVDVIGARGEADYAQLYLDQAYPPEVGAAVNDSTATLFAGRGTPQNVV